MLVPSRDSAMTFRLNPVKAAFAGRAIVNRATGVGADGDGRVSSHTPPPTVAAATNAAAAHTSRSRPAVSRTARAVSLVVALLSAIHLNSASRSRAVCQRSSASFSRHRRTTRSSAAGVSGCSDERAGGSAPRIAAITLAVVLPVKARAPVTISYSRTPNAKMSDRASASRPSICSGDMYWNVPRMVPRAVSGACAADTVTSAAETIGIAPEVFARPKSSSFAVGGADAPPLRTRNTLPGFRSRCTMPARCALSRASAIWIATARASRTVSAPRPRRAASVSPSRYSRTRNCTRPPPAVPGPPPVRSLSPMSWRAQMLGWFSAAMLFASRSKRSRNCGSSARCAGSTLMATSRSSRVSRAL